MCEPNLEFLSKLTDWRNDAQTIQFRLLKLITERESDIRQNDDRKAIAQLLVGTSFSLWRAVFFADRPLGLDDALSDAKAMSGNKIVNNRLG